MAKKVRIPNRSQTPSPFQGREDVTIRVRVCTRSPRPGITGTLSEGYRARLCSVPVDDKANRELVSMLSKKLRVRKEDVIIISGRKSRDKVIKVYGINRSKAELE